MDYFSICKLLDKRTKLRISYAKDNQDKLFLNKKMDL